MLITLDQSKLDTAIEEYLIRRGVCGDVKETTFKVTRSPQTIAAEILLTDSLEPLDKPKEGKVTLSSEDQSEVTETVAPTSVTASEIEETIEDAQKSETEAPQLGITFPVSSENTDSEESSESAAEPVAESDSEGPSNPAPKKSLFAAKPN